jgi:hypothetical protein
LVDGWFSFVVHSGEYGVEPPESLLGLSAVSLDPSRHQVEDFGLEVTRAALRVLAPAHQPSAFEHLEVL